MGWVTLGSFADFFRAILQNILVDLRAPLDIGIFRHQRRFCQENALVMATLSALAYLNPHEQEEWAQQQPSVKALHCLDSANNAAEGLSSPDTGTQVTVIETDQALFISPRGTPLNIRPGANLQWQDLKNNLSGWPCQNYAGTARVHRGFKRAAEGIWEQLKPLLSQALASHKAIHMSGHSLGGAIAIQLADRMHHELKALPESLTTLGSPAVGWSAQQKHLEIIGLDQRALSFVNNIDPIPGIVPGGKLTGKSIYFDSQGQASEGLEGRGIDRLKGIAQALGGLNFNPLQDHYPREYRNLMAAAENAALLNSL